MNIRVKKHILYDKKTNKNVKYGVKREKYTLRQRMDFTRQMHLLPCLFKIEYNSRE